MDYKVLVNKENEIDINKLQNRKLITCSNIYGNDIEIESKTYRAYLELLDFLKTKNIEIGLVDCYRTIEKQQELWDSYEQDYGLEYTKRFVAKPGTSEHHTGLAIDIEVCLNGKYFEKDNNQLIANKNYMAVYDKLSTYLHLFGFILRYPKNKENITGYNYEPWHIRYVGKKTATIIYSENITLEEYYQKYNLDGVIVINKPRDMTSRDVADFVSKTLDTEKVGHTGTLDPLATGVLVLTLGKYTKLSEDLTALDKEYIAEVKVGIETDTLDISGNIIKESKEFNLNNLEEVINSFQKTYLQEVPKYSAVKVNGKKLYQYARNGEDVILPQKTVTIKKIKLLSQTTDTFTFSCTVSKGTYIRSLIRDIGESLNIPMTMTKLKRTRQGIFEIEKSSTLEDIKNNKHKVLKIDDIFDYPKIEVTDKMKKKIENGVQLDDNYHIKDKVIFSYQGENLAIYQKNKNKLKVYKMI